MVSHKKICDPQKRGYSLLELILSLALTVVVTAIIAQSINLYMLQLARQQARVERRLIAQNSLAMMGNDIRAAIQFKATDFGGLNTLLETQAILLGAIEEREEENVLEDEEEVSYRPTMIGTNSSIMLDISRLPRLDQYNPLMEKPSEMQSTISDIKTVTYFVSSMRGGYDPKISQRESEITGGLYRRELDRAVGNFRGEETIGIQPDEFTQLVASEVAELQFRYFDGNDWSDSWDSEQESGFPTAVEIAVVVDPRRSSTAETGYVYNGFDQSIMERHRQTVFLPMAEPNAEEEQ